MARILVVYGTTDGHTGKVAAFIAETLRTQGAQVELVEAGPAAPDPAWFDGVVVAASLHARGYQRAVRAYVRRHAPALSDRPSVFVSVCLGILQHDATVDRELNAIVDRFLGDTGWTRATRKIVAGALLYTRYNWVKRFVMRRIARKAGGGTDTATDYEYTDWVDLALFAAGFARTVADTSDAPGRRTGVEGATRAGTGVRAS